MNRRAFQRQCIAGAVTAVTLPFGCLKSDVDRNAAAQSVPSKPAQAESVGAENQPPTRPRVAVIGHTGRGDFGHGIDKAWLQVPAVELVAVSDGNAEALPRSLDQLSLARSQGYSDYRRMLSEVRPNYVGIGPRHVDQHHDMALAAIESGVQGIYLEKPFVRTPAEADSVLAAASKHGCRIAVAHRNRYHPALPVISRLIQEGIIGRVLEIRGRGKGDHRGGPEDLWVLGSHVLNLFDYFGEGVTTVSGEIFQDGQRLTEKHSLSPAREGFGDIGGNEIRARYRLANGLEATFDSVANSGLGNFGFGLRIVGSDGFIQLHCDQNPIAYLVLGNPFRVPEKPPAWIPITAAGVGKAESPEQRQACRNAANHSAAIVDLIESVEHPDRQPLCSGKAAAMTIEMICGVYASHLAGGESITIPLANRNPSLS